MNERTCSVDDCEGVARGRGLCWKHYKRLQRAGGVVRPSLEERLWRQIDKRDDGCWIWTGEISVSGYGRIAVGVRGKRTVHRLVYETLVGPVEVGHELDHLCRVRACCNPQHLEPVTPRENWIRGESPSARNARKSTCLNGHPLVDATWNGGRRYCPTCAKARNRRWRERNRT